MGIVVCIAMLVGALALFKKQPGKTLKFAAEISLIFGIWNFAWYGLRHLGTFWGYAALATGIVMLMTGLILLVESNSSGKLKQAPALLVIYKYLQPIRTPILIALIAGFLLYAVSLIQLNLGYTIIR